MLEGNFTVSASDKQRYFSHVAPVGDCLMWVGSTWPGGYGVFNYKGKKVLSHRFSYLINHGSIENGKVLDHICRNRLCVNTTHLRAVSRRENVTENSLSIQARNKAKTHCCRGHEFNKDNTYIKANGCRDCRECSKIRHNRKKV
jgi:hypothetical protein